MNDFAAPQYFANNIGWVDPLQRYLSNPGGLMGGSQAFEPTLNSQPPPSSYTRPPGPGASDPRPAAVDPTSNPPGTGGTIFRPVDPTYTPQPLDPIPPWNPGASDPRPPAALPTRPWNRGNSERYTPESYTSPAGDPTPWFNPGARDPRFTSSAVDPTDPNSSLNPGLGNRMNVIQALYALGILKDPLNKTPYGNTSERQPWLNKISGFPQER